VTALRGRLGNRSIPVDEYPPGHMERINATLNGIAAEEDDEPTWADRVLDTATDGPVAGAVTLIFGILTVLVVVVQVGRWTS
jgi:hypothetical protein